jgi:segregation and condensation protein A
MVFSVDQASFKGPLGLLLELLDKKELEITTVALGKIADDYLNYLDQTEVASEELADFLVVASRLIYLKSRELMPYLRIDEEEDEVASLEDQLRLYRMFAESAERLGGRFSDISMLYRRPFVKVKTKTEQVEFLAPENVHAGSLQGAFQAILKRLAPFFALQQASIERVKSVEERLEELRGAIETRAKMTFKDVVRSAKSKPEVVVSFLALLELIRRQIVRASQGKDRDIIIERL